MKKEKKKSEIKNMKHFNFIFNHQKKLVIKIMTFYY